MKKLFIFAIVAVLIVWRCTEPVHAQDQVEGALSTNEAIYYTTAPLFTRAEKGSWKVSRIHVVEYPDARPVFCIATPGSQTVECWYRNVSTDEGYEFTELPKERRG